MAQQVHEQQKEISALKQGSTRSAGHASSAADDAQNGLNGVKEEWERMAASWRAMTAEWAGVRESAKAMAEAEALRQSAEEKRWRAGEALAAAVLDAASAEESREYAERARQVVCLPSSVQYRQLLACLLLDASCGPGEVACRALWLWAPWPLTASMYAV